MILETIPVGMMEVNCYILASRAGSRAIIIDPGDEEEKIRRILNKHKLSPAFIINTHGHYDHIGCDDKFAVPIYVHAKDEKLLKNAQLNLSGWLASGFVVKSEIRPVNDKDIISLDSIELEVMHIPGHTPGGIALLMKKPQNNIVFTGDTLFCRGIGRSDLPEADAGLLVKTIKEKLLVLLDETKVYPGHGASSTIGDEKRNNPFLMNT